MMGILATIDNRGRLLIPSEVRKATGLGEQDTVIVKPIGAGEFRVVGLKNVVDRGLGMFRHLRQDGKSMVDELLEERRREAKEESR